MTNSEYGNKGHIHIPPSGAQREVPQPPRPDYEEEALARHRDAVRRNQVVPGTIVILGGRRAGKTQRAKEWEAEHWELTGVPTDPVQGVLTGQVPVRSMPVAMDPTKNCEACGCDLKADGSCPWCE